MTIVLFGTSHRLSPVDRRAQFVASAADAATWLALVRATSASIAEVFVLATCNRIEFYVATDDPEAAERELRRFLADTCAADLLHPDQPHYVHVGEAAVDHLGRVACGLESMILGEAEIAGQIRRAAVAARHAGSLGVYLERAIAGALRASGRARSGTRISSGALSVASASIALLEREFATQASSSGRASDAGQTFHGGLAIARSGEPGDDPADDAGDAGSLRVGLEGRRVLVVGAGQAGRQALACAAKRRPALLSIASRSDRHAAEAAAASAARVVPLDALASALADADALVVALNAPLAALDRAAVAQAMRGRRARPLAIVDLSVPRAVDAAVATLEGVSIWTVDDLGDVVRASETRRAREIPAVERIVRDEASRAMRAIERRASSRATARRTG